MHFELGHGMTGKHFCNFGQRSLQFTMTHLSSTRLFLRADNKTPHKSTSVPNTLETRIGSWSSELEGKIGAHHPQAQFTFVNCQMSMPSALPKLALRDISKGDIRIRNPPPPTVKLFFFKKYNNHQHRFQDQGPLYAANDVRLCAGMYHITYSTILHKC